MLIKKTAVVVVDMTRDACDTETALAKRAEGIIPTLNWFLDACRSIAVPVVFACDSFLPEDFLFRATGYKPYCVRGTEGCLVSRKVKIKEHDMYVPKRRLSAFYKTDLDQMLRTYGIEKIAVCGMTTSVCVIATCLDAISHDFYCTLVEDCCVDRDEERHRAVISIFRDWLNPIFQIKTAREIVDELYEEKILSV